MRGRKPDGEAVQDAKGNPGKRQRKQKAATVEAAAAQIVANPRFLSDKRLKSALAIWRELEPELRRLHLLEPLDRNTFAMYCVHMADWITATLDIHKHGSWMKAKNVNGDEMPRLNPAVKVREIAERHILQISERFGLDPANRYKLMRDQAAAPKPAGGTGDLFSDQPAQPAPDKLPSPLGLMDELGSTPPGSLN